MEPTEEVKKYRYETKSLDEFAVLLAMGAKIVDVDRKTDDRFYKFTLEGIFDLEKATFDLASRTLVVNAYELCDALRRAKSIIHHR